MKQRATKPLLFFVILSFFILTSICGCSNTEPVVPKIAIVEDRPQEWADAMKSGFRDGLIERGVAVGAEVTIESYSAAGDPQALAALADSLSQGQYVLIYTLATPPTQALFRKIKTTPILFGAVTDPVKAGFFEGDVTHPLGNITGTQDVWPYDAQFDLIQALVPRLKKIGIVYNPREPNSQVSLEYVRTECRKRSIALHESTVTDASGIEAAVNALLDKRIGLLFIPADNTALSASRTIIEISDRRKVPVFTGVCDAAQAGAVATLGVNYYQLGKANADQAVAILSHSAQASEIPVVTAQKSDICLNLRSVKRLDISIPKEILKGASKIYHSR